MPFQPNPFLLVGTAHGKEIICIGCPATLPQLVKVPPGHLYMCSVSGAEIIGIVNGFGSRVIYSGRNFFIFVKHHAKGGLEVCVEMNVDEE